MAAPASDRLTIIVPVYNEVRTIAAVVERLLTIDLPIDREIIVVNDGSSDGTGRALDAVGSRSALVTIVHLEKNRGKGYAVRIGFERARGTIVAIQDADLELDPAQLSALVAPIVEGQSLVVYGSRFLSRTDGVPAITTWANRALTSLTNVLYGSALTDMETCYKVMRTDVARSLPLSADRFDIEPEITAQLLLSGHRILEVPVTFQPRSRAAGKKIGWRDGLTAVRVLLKLRRGADRPR